MNIVVDASVAVKWVATEAGTDAALDLLDDKIFRIAPDFLLIEAANVLWMKVRRGELPREQADPSLDFIRSAIRRFVPTESLIYRAFALSLDFDHPAYDCIYLACCEHENADLVTADRRLIKKLEQRKSDIRLRLLPGTKAI